RGAPGRGGSAAAAPRASRRSSELLCARLDPVRSARETRPRRAAASWRAVGRPKTRDTLRKVPTNQIRAVTFRPVPPDPSGESEGGHALSLAIDVPDPARLLGLLEEVIGRLKA